MINNITALCLLRIADNPMKQIVVYSDNKLVIKQTHEALKEANLKHYIAGYTKSRIVFEQGGSLNFVPRYNELALCGINPDEILVDGSIESLSMDEKMDILPLASLVKNPALKYINKFEHLDVPNKWLNNLFFSE